MSSYPRPSEPDLFKLGLSEAEDISKRVTAALAFLSEEREAGDARPTGACP